eukprot:301110-Chlamydomonas_euryale.AAC.1
MMVGQWSGQSHDGEHAAPPCQTRTFAAPPCRTWTCGASMPNENMRRLHAAHGHAAPPCHTRTCGVSMPHEDMRRLHATRGHAAPPCRTWTCGASMPHVDMRHLHAAIPLSYTALTRATCPLSPLNPRILSALLSLPLLSPKPLPHHLGRLDCQVAEETRTLHTVHHTPTHPHLDKAHVLHLDRLCRQVAEEAALRVANAQRAPRRELRKIKAQGACLRVEQH